MGRNSSIRIHEITFCGDVKSWADAIFREHKEWPFAKAAIEEFGKGKDLKNLLKDLQLKALTREGNNVPKILKECIMSMDDYFPLASYNTLAQGIMGKAKLEGSTKLWWKLHC